MEKHPPRQHAAATALLVVATAVAAPAGGRALRTAVGATSSAAADFTLELALESIPDAPLGCYGQGSLRSRLRQLVGRRSEGSRARSSGGRPVE